VKRLLKLTKSFEIKVREMQINHPVYNFFFLGDCPNLVRYAETMKTEFWPDWDKELAAKKN
jgi:hypothetical protein